MATAQQIEANRANAQLSTGPRTEAGKATASRNATSHGLATAHTILPGEDAAAFDQLIANLIREHAPLGETETFLVRQLAQNHWKLDRLDAIESSIYAYILDGAAVEITAYTKIAAIFMGNSASCAAIDRLERYRGSTRSAYHRSIKELRACQSTREARELAENKTNPIPTSPPEASPENRTKPIRPAIVTKTILGAVSATPPPSREESPAAVPSRDREAIAPRTGCISTALKAA